MRNSISLACIVFSLGLSACNIDLLGFLLSESTPDGRFDSACTSPKDLVPGVSDSFSFIFVSDLHIESATHSYLEDLGSRLDDAKFVVFGGDITQNGKREDFDYFITQAKALGIPYYAVIGNHDVYSGGWANAVETLGKSAYSVKLGDDARLICLDTASGTLGTRQYRWLREELHKTRESFIVVATHVQFFINQYFEDQQLSFPEESALLLRLFSQYGVDLVLAGHSHAFDFKKIGVVKHYVSGSYLDRSSDASYLYITKNADGSCDAAQRYH